VLSGSLRITEKAIARHFFLPISKDFATYHSISFSIAESDARSLLMGFGGSLFAIIHKRESFSLERNELHRNIKRRVGDCLRSEICVFRISAATIERRLGFHEPRSFLSHCVYPKETHSSSLP